MPLFYPGQDAGMSEDRWTYPAAGGQRTFEDE